MKFWSVFFGIFWLFCGLLAIMDYLTPFCAMCACLLAAAYNFEELYR